MSSSMERRGFIALTAAACGWTLLGGIKFASAAGNAGDRTPPSSAGNAGDRTPPSAAGNAGDRTPMWLSAYAEAGSEPRFGVAAFDAAGRVAFSCLLPGRAHAVAPHPDGTHAVVMARRPGRWFGVVDLRAGRLRDAATALPDDRRGAGHGVFSADASLFYMVEDDAGKERGALAVLDVAAGYVRVGEIAGVGVGPHEVLSLDGGRSLAVADGGVLTHPDTGRVKLNVDDMDPALIYVDPSAGRVVETVRLPADYGNLGIRHIAAGPGGAVFFGMQDERPTGALQALVGVHRRGSAPAPLAAPAEVWSRLSGYVGSVACDGREIAASSPRGGAVAVWDAQTLAFKRLVELPDGCGLGVRSGGGLLMTNGFGRIQNGAGEAVADEPSHRWDNHLSAPLFIG